MSIFWKVDAPTVSIVIACCALFVSFISITLSVLSYRKDRWKLSLEAWIGRQEGLIQAHLFVKVANVGRRALTIEKICLQVFEDEIEALNKLNTSRQRLAIIERVEHIGSVARFPHTLSKGFPVQLGENEPTTVELILMGIDPLSRSRFCLVYVTGRRAPIKIPCGVKDRRSKTRFFSGS
jgi:hypothetical protein